MTVQPEWTITHRNWVRIIKLFYYKSASGSKLWYLNLFTDFENAKKQLSFWKQAHTAALLTIYNKIENE